MHLSRNLQADRQLIMPLLGCSMLGVSPTGLQATTPRSAPLSAASPMFHPHGDPAAQFEFSARFLASVANHGWGTAREGLVLECGESPRLTGDDLAALHGNDFDGQPGDPGDFYPWSLPETEYRAKQAAEASRRVELFNWDREFAIEQREVDRHNAEVMGYGSW